MPYTDKLTVITDVGSTTTKAILLDLGDGTPALRALYSSPTTVEQPFNDVRFGVKRAVIGLEKEAGTELLMDRSDTPELIFANGIRYLSTSSAGGGLQILVIGLTLFDSASSAKRAAYGAGGIILDTFAIDDKRQASQQMLAMRMLHPDMILLCGGTDGGAISGVLRMAEIMRMAKPRPKFETSQKIPTIYAGNQDAVPMIKEMITRDFDLYILPNLRPGMNSENLAPTQAKIQELFMENVMEHAPGYAELKQGVSSAIIPTPSGVMKSLGMIAKRDGRNIFAFDIGGATTDIFSQINGHFQRTVSANLGLSYSALNVMKESGIANLTRWLPSEISEEVTRDYVANKCLRPTSLPESETEMAIEQALTREALRIALDQHRIMHFNTKKLGYLDKVVDNGSDPFDRKFNYQHYEEQYYFHESDIDLVIAAGGIFAHTADQVTRAMMVIDAIRPKGLTEIAVDADFTTPHMGVLSESDAVTAEKLLRDRCLQGLAWHVAPVFPKGFRKGGLSVSIERNGKTETLSVGSDALKIIPAGAKKLSFKLSGTAYISLKHKQEELATDLPVIIDTRNALLTAASEHHILMRQDNELSRRELTLQDLAISKLSERTREVQLPYWGETRFAVGAQVQPTDVVAVNRFNPPRLFIVDGFRKFGILDKKTIEAALRVKIGDHIDFDQIVAEVPDNPDWPRYIRNSRQISSPVRGKLEYTDQNTGLMVLSEIQDYSLKPVSVNLAEGLGVKPRQVGRYLSKSVGDFVFRGDPLASRKERGAEGPEYRFVKAPTTGTIIGLDSETGILTIKYSTSPMEFHSHVRGRVSDLEEGRSICLSYQALRLNGLLGLGKDRSGRLRLLDKSSSIYAADVKGSVLAVRFAPSKEDLKLFASSGISGLICCCVSEKALTEFMEAELGVINTGNENLAFSVLVLGGFGDLPMPEGLWKDLRAYEGRHCYLSPHTRVRAGVARPFVDLLPEA